MKTTFGKKLVKLMLMLLVIVSLVVTVMNKDIIIQKIINPIQEVSTKMVSMAKGISMEDAKALVSSVLGYSEHWGVDLNQFAGVTEFVTKSLETILSSGIREAIKKLF